MNIRTALLGLAVCLVAVSCGEKKAETTSKETPKKELTPKPLTAIDEDNQSKLPPGHPPINKELPPGHPPVNKDIMSMHTSKGMTKFDRPINIPEEVQKTWKVATLDIVDRASGKVVKEFKAHKGDTLKYENLEIKVLYIVPHLVLDNGYTSGSNEPQNPAVLIEVKENGKTIYAGPIYQKFPSMYNINHPKYVILLKGISKG